MKMKIDIIFKWYNTTEELTMREMMYMYRWLYKLTSKEMAKKLGYGENSSSNIIRFENGYKYGDRCMKAIMKKFRSLIKKEIAAHNLITLHLYARRTPNEWNCLKINIKDYE